MCEERAKTRCVQCELVQWADHANCRRCGQALPPPIVNVVERVVERVFVQQDSQCLENLQEASKLISATAAKLQESRVVPELPTHCGLIPGSQLVYLRMYPEAAEILSASAAGQSDSASQPPSRWEKPM